MAAALAQQSEILSFGEVYGAHIDFVWRYTQNRGVPPSAIEDVVQEIFIVVHRKLGSFEGRSWIALIARRVTRDYLRKVGARSAIRWRATK